MTPRRVVHVVADPEPSAELPTPGPGSPMADDVERVARFLQRLAGARFYGRVSIGFQNGRLVDIHTDQSIKIETLP